MADPYAVLGVDRSAGDDEVRAAYRARSMLLHPDLHQDRPERVRREAQRAMTQLTEAYEAVTGERARARASRDPARAGSGPAYRLGRLFGRTGVGRSAADAAEREGGVAFRLGWLVGRRRSR